ncbi:MAG: SDR family NAD(P)-dependent oxidoreductase, partial [Myxococcota bacterium]
ASKFAVRGFTEALRQEVAKHDVLISCVHPGGIQTNIVRAGRIYDQETPGDANKLKQTFETKLARTTAPAAADAILRGVLEGRERILIGQDAKVMDVVQRVFPTRYGRAFERLRKYLSS